jgi:hypothetical protein
MIRLICPGCKKKLGIGDHLAGRVVVCPECKGKVRVPKPEPPAEVEMLEEVEELEEVEAKPPRPRPSTAVKRPAPTEDRPRPPTGIRRRPADEEDEPPRRKPRDEAPAEEDEDRPRRKRKRKPKRYRLKSERGESNGLFGMEPFTVGLLGVGAVCVPLLLLAVFLPPVLLVTLAVGVLLMIAGGIWLLIVAFSDSPLQGVLCWFVPLYSIFYLVTHWEECKRPFFVQMVGLLLLMANSCVGGVAGAMHGGAS